MYRILGPILAVIFVLISVPAASAKPKESKSAVQPVPEVTVDPCLSLPENPVWNQEIGRMTENIKRRDYDAALENTQKLLEICDRSPILNYSIARIYQEKGDNQKALVYLKRATDNTAEFNVTGQNLEMMWYDRYEAEHPNARPDAIEARKKDNEAKQLKIESLQRDVEAANERTKLSEAEKAQWKQMATDATDGYTVGLWTSVAFAGVGVALAAVGGTMMAVTKEAIDNDKLSADKDGVVSKGKSAIKADYTAYMIMLGTGAGLAVAGGVVAGILGAKYAKLKDACNTVSFGIAPTGASLTWEF